MNAKQFEAVLRSWYDSPLKFVREAIGIEPTEQQTVALEDLRKLVQSRIWTHQGNLAAVPREKVIERAPEELREYFGKIGLSIMSGQGTGKDGFCAWLILWVLICCPRPKLLATAPVAHQLKSVLWAEVSKWLNRRAADGSWACCIRQFITVQSDKIFLTETGGKESFCEGRTASPNDSAESQAETLAGRHEDYLFFIMDEASGIPDPVFRPIEGTLTGKVNIPFIIFNPTRRSGYALGTHYGPDKDRWVRRRWNAEESQIVSREHVEAMKAKYGYDSNAYRVRVLGLPPTADDGSLIPWDWAMRATDREIDVDPEEPIILGIDVGRQGDQSVICVRQGAKVLEFRRKSEPDTTKTAQWILEAIADWEPEYTYIDVIGLGWGVFDMVKQRYRGIRGIDVSTASSRPEKFDRLRDEVYSRVRSVFETGLISIPLDDDLINELTCIKYEITTAGKTKIEGKKDMKRRGLASPNMADALALTFSQDQRISRLSDKKGSDKYRRKVAEERFTWMGA